MRWRACKRLLIGWLVLGLLLNMPSAVVGQCYYGYGSCDSDDGGDGPELWQLVLIGLLVFLPAVQGCVLNQQWDSDFP